MQFKRIFVTRNACDTSLRPGGVGVCAFAFGDHRNRSLFCRLQGESQPGDSTADNDKIVRLHAKRILSINRVLPKNTASASTAFGLTESIGCKVSPSTRPT